MHRGPQQARTIDAVYPLPTCALPEPCILAVQLVGCGFAGYRFYQHRKHQVNGIHVKRIIQRHNEKHHHGEVREATNAATLVIKLR